MNTRFFRSFSTELMKIASGIPDDAGIRELLADREGEEYLPGGELPSNEPGSAMLQKLGGPFALAAGAHDLHAKTKIDSPYQGTRDHAVAAGKGALTGAAAMGLVDKLSKTPFVGHKHYRAAAAIGAGGMLADRVFRHHRAEHDSHKDKTAGIVSPSAEHVVKSPAGVLHAAQQTGSVRGKPRMVGKASKAIRIGTRKFQMPTRLGVR